MVKGKITYIILGIIIVTAVILRIFSQEGNWACVNGSWTKHGNPKEAKPLESCPGEQAEDNETFTLEGGNLPLASSSLQEATSTLKEITPLIISSPEPDATISSPLVVKGQALGSWFFEASLPIKLLDSKGELIVQVPATAESDWMVSSLVPFAALLEFNTTATSGFLVVSKDNPSGLPENDASISIPVKFLNK